MRYRKIARVIGVINMVWSVLGASLSILFLIFLAFVSGAIFVDRNLQDNEDEEENLTLKNTISVTGGPLLAYIWIFLILLCCIFCIQIFGSWKLIKGTTESVDPADGVSFCRIWRGITIFITILLFISSTCCISEIVAFGNPAFGLILCGIYALEIYFVQQYIKQLKSIIPQIDLLLIAHCDPSEN